MFDHLPEAAQALYRRRTPHHVHQPILLPSMPNYQYRNWTRAGCPPDRDPNANNRQACASATSSTGAALSQDSSSRASTAPSCINILDDFVTPGQASSKFLGKPTFLYNPTDDSYYQTSGSVSLTPRPSPSKGFRCPRNPARAFKKPDPPAPKTPLRRGFAFLRKKPPTQSATVANAPLPPAFRDKTGFPFQGFRPQGFRPFPDSPLYIPQVANPSRNFVNPCLR